MTDSTKTVSHTADRIEYVAKESAKEKQSGNTRALLFQNLPGAREVRSFLGGVLGTLETTGDALYRTMTLAARPQDIKHTGKIIRNGIKATIAEKPQVETKGFKEYRQNLRAPKLTRDSLKQYHEPYGDDTKFFDTHGTDLSLAPKKSDKRYTKLAKFIPFTAGKIIKAPLYAGATLIGATTDTFRWMKAQKIRDLVTLNFTKTSRNKTSHAWKKLTSRAYNGNTTDNSTQNSKQEDSEKKQEQDKKNTSEKKSFWSRLWPFGKKTQEKKETEVKKEDIKKETDKQSAPKNQPESPKQEEIKTKEKTPEQETIAPEILATIATGHAAIKELKQAFENKDKAALDIAKDKILRAQATEKNINKDDLPEEHKALFKEIKSTASDIGQLKYKIEDPNKPIDNKEANKSMAEYINQEQQKFTKFYNEQKEINKEDTEKWIKSLQGYHKAGGKIVFTGKQDKSGNVINGTLDTLTIEDDKVKVGFTSDDNKSHTDEISLDKVFDSKFSVHAPETKIIAMKTEDEDKQQKPAA